MDSDFVVHPRVKADLEASYAEADRLFRESLDAMMPVYQKWLDELVYGFAVGD